MQSYFRQMRAYKRIQGQTGSITQYEVAHVRKHKSYIEWAQISGNLVISYENDGLLAVTLINYEDGEEASSKFIIEHAESKILYFYFYEESQRLVVLTRTGQAYLYQILIEEEASDFSITLIGSIDQVFTLPQNDEMDGLTSYLKNVIVY